MSIKVYEFLALVYILLQKRGVTLMLLALLVNNMGIFTPTRTPTHKVPGPTTRVRVPVTFFMDMGTGLETHGCGYR